MGLKFPENLEAWFRWEQKQNLLRYVKTKVRHEKKEKINELIFACKGSNQNPQILVALEATSPTQIAALLSPVIKLEELGISVAIVGQISDQEYLASIGFTEFIKFGSVSNVLLDRTENIEQVIAAGNYAEIGRWAYKQSKKLGWEFNVIQHGLITPFAPPLPRDSVLFSFSEEDSEFWKSGRTDVGTHAVGSQLFYEALQRPSTDTVVTTDEIVFLGQMHGAELPRASFAKSSYDFCKKSGASYRPHPAEKDKISTLTHKLWAKQGINIDTSGTPLNQSNTPVVSIFSTGVLEAAIRGVPAWVYHSNPPTWLKEFWHRYGMNEWGSESTPSPIQPETEPALAIAKNIAHRLEK